jgi:hypothetical protein
MHNFSVETSWQNNWASSVVFKKMPKENSRPNGRKFAQSGHPGWVKRTYIAHQILLS